MTDYITPETEKKKKQFTAYKHNGFEVLVKGLSGHELPQMYKDSAGYTHFKTNKIHVWGKQLLDPAIATEHMNYMVGELDWNFNKYQNPRSCYYYCKTRRGQVQMSSYGGDIIYKPNAS